MSSDSKIEWTDATWNPTVGCTKVSAGCDHCYAEGIVNRFAGTKAYPERFDTLVLHEDRLRLPLTWTKPRRVFVNSMSDLFHKDVPDEFLARVFAVMALSPRHTYQVLTKRHGRMGSLLSGQFTDSGSFGWLVKDAMWALVGTGAHGVSEAWRSLPNPGWWPLRNVWLGVSVEDQAAADLRIPALLGTPAAVRFLSCEPLLGPVDLTPWLWLTGASTAGPFRDAQGRIRGRSGGIGGQSLTYAPSRDLGWVIVGGESGAQARPMHPEWARSLRDQCAAAGVPFLFKQWGSWRPLAGNECARSGDQWPAGTHGVMCRRVGKKTAGRELDDRLWDEYPEPVL